MSSGLSQKLWRHRLGQILFSAFLYSSWSLQLYCVWLVELWAVSRFLSWCSLVSTRKQYVGGAHESRLFVKRLPLLGVARMASICTRMLFNLVDDYDSTWCDSPGTEPCYCNLPLFVKSWGSLRKVMVLLLSISCSWGTSNIWWRNGARHQHVRGDETKTTITPVLLLVEA